MGKLFVVTTLWDAPYYDLSRFFYSRRDELEKNGLHFDPVFAPQWQLWNHEHIPLQVNWYRNVLAAEADSSHTDLVYEQFVGTVRRLEQGVAEGKNILCLYGTPGAQTLPLFFDCLEQCALLRQYEIFPIMIVSSQDHEALSAYHRLWRSMTPEAMNRSFVNEHHHHTLDETYVLFTERCGKDNCTLLEHKAPELHRMDPALLDSLLRVLKLPAAMGTNYSPEVLYPYSGAALDFADALRGFPFSGHRMWDRRIFDRTLLMVECEQGFATGNYFPHKFVHKLMKQCRPGNARLAELSGCSDLFCGPSVLNILPDAPDKVQNLPHITVEQAHACISAFSQDWRDAFLRYFRDIPPQCEGAALIASCLENYRARHSPCSPFCVPRKTPAVSVLTLTYNHEKFIETCMESVSEQRCKFSMEHIIIDDCSSDNTTSIIDDYASRHAHVWPLYMPYKTTNGEQVHKLFSKCRSQYAALCDGDDYFTDPCKLQKQVDFLDANPECALCFHPVQVVYEDGTDRSRVYPPLELMPRGMQSFYYAADLLKANFIQTNSVMYRWRFTCGLPSWFQTTLVPGDWYWHLLHAEMGKIGFIPKIMSVYRRHKNSLYYSAENQDTSVPHRLLHGMKELETYDVINRHFERRYERAIVGFANNVLVDFLRHAQSTGDDTFLHKAGEQYPVFMEYFLRDVQVVVKPPR